MKTTQLDSTLIEAAPRETQSLAALIEAQVARTPAAHALFAPAGLAGDPHEEALSYEELNHRANALAHYLRGCGVGPDVLVGICQERSIGLVLSVLAVLKAGGACVPLDPTYPPERLRMMMEDASLPVILTQAKHLDSLPATSAAVVCLDRDARFFTNEPTSNLEPSSGPDNLAYVIYTSGSTGKPKGVAMRQEPILRLMEWQLANWSFPEPARVLQFASLNFDVSFQEILSTWISGGTLVLVPDAVRRDSPALLEFLMRHRVQRLFLPFIALKHLAEAALSRETMPADLREIITAGEQLKITPALVHFFSRLGSCTLENQYGPSETHVVTAYRLSGAPDVWPALPPIGHAVAGAELEILNENLQRVAPGESGELFLGGTCLARGYLNRPELTAARFIQNPFDTDLRSRLYRTGDLARQLPDGNIEFLGRMDHQVKIGGIRVELAEIEAALHQHPGIKEAVVTTREGSNGDRQLVACFVPQPAQNPKPSELRAFLRQKMPAHLIPAGLVRLPALPLNPNGKVDRLALPTEALEETEEDFSVQVKLPKNPLEMQLQLVFECFFKRRPIGVDTSFFELGGDSLQALNLILEVERATGKKLSLAILYQAPTIETLAVAIEKEAGGEWSALAPLQPSGTRPPLFLVHTTPGDVLGYGGLVYHLGRQQPCYGIQSPALHKLEDAITSIEEMAAHYIRLVRARQPQGPYYLGGWCYGGIVAVEMAHQLRAAGQEVAFLGLIETPAPAPGWTKPSFYARRLGRLLKMGPRSWKTYLSQKLKYYRGVKTNNELRFQRVDPSAVPDAAAVAAQNKHLERLERVYEINVAAINRYRSRPYPGRVTLFNASVADPALIPDPLYGWAGLAGEIEVLVTPGDHDSILMEPNVRILARQLDGCLRACQEARPPT